MTAKDVQAVEGEEPTSAVAGTRKPQRTHRGRTLDERKAERRGALLDSALELFGTKGYAATSIGELCKISYVTTRYFYEEYGDKETLLVELYEKLIAGVSERVLTAEAPAGPDHARDLARARLAAFIYAVTDDERAARVLLFESGSALLETRRRETHQFFAEFIGQIAFRYIQEGRVGTDRYDFGLLSLMLVGAINEAMTHWVLSPPDERTDPDHIINTIVEMYLLIRQGVLLDEA